MQTYVYLVLGFLDSGKTSFLNNTLGSLPKEYRAAVISCEEGEEEYILPEGVKVYSVASREDLTLELMAKVQEEAAPNFVLIEMNGMWTLTDWTLPMPADWRLLQTVCVMDATTFTVYSSNMQQQTMEKLQRANMVVFNRCTDTLAAELRSKNLRIANRKAQFYLDFGNGRMEDYQTPGQTHFDLTQAHIDLDDDDFALWYVEALDHPEWYVDKTLRLKLRLNRKTYDPPYVTAGRWIMTCCERDMTFFPVACAGEVLSGYEDEELVEVTARVGRAYWPPYDKIGPVLNILTAKSLESSVTL